MSRRFDLSRPTWFFSNDRFKSPPSEFRGCERLVLLFLIFMFRRGGQDGCAGREGYDSVCAHSGPSNGSRTAMQFTVLKDGYNPWWFRRPLSVARRASSSHLMVGEARRTPPRFFKAATGSESLEGRIWYLGGRLVHRHRSLPAPLSRARVGVRLQPAPPDQPYCPDSSRVVCRSRSGPMRVGIPSQSSRPWSRDPECSGTYRSLRISVAPWAPQGDHFSKRRS